MRLFAVLRKSLLELVREPWLVGMVVLTPLAFLLIYGFSYQTPSVKTYPVLFQAGEESLTRDAIRFLAEQKYDDGRPVFSFQAASSMEIAEQKLKDRTAAALIILSINDAKSAFSSTIRGDAMSIDFLNASFLLDSYLSKYHDKKFGRWLPVNLLEEPLSARATGLRTDFSTYAPGLLIFALLLLIPQTALLLGREIRTHTIRRVRLTGISSWEFLGGIAISQILIGVLQGILIVCGFLLFGLDPSATLGPTLLAGLLVSLSAIGSGLIVGCLVQNDSQAVNLGSLVAMVQVFVSGSFFPLPLPTLFTFAAHEITWNDILPATHIMLALQQSVLFGVDWNILTFRLLSATVLTAIFLMIGIILFQWKVLGKKHIN